MKKTKTAILLAIVILIVGSLAVYAVSSADQTAEPVLSIDYCNLSFRDSVCIKYAVSSTVENVRLLLWTAPAAEYTNGSQNAEITSGYLENINGKEYTVFDYTALAAKQMTDVVYARAYVQLDGKDYYSDVKKYSILQYAYNKLGKTGTATSDENLKEMLSYMLEYGAAAQRYLNSYKIDRLATADWYEVKLTAGTLDDGCRQGLYLPGDALVLTADAIDADGNLFSHWSDSEGNNLSSSAVFTLTVGSKNEVYTPVYASDAPQTTYTVVFKDYDGTVLKTEIVEDGKSATAPEAPVRNGYSFAGWDKQFESVKSDLIVTAFYTEELSEPAIIVDTVMAKAGETVEVNVRMKNNPGMAASTFKIKYDDAVLDLNSVKFNDAFGGDFDKVGSLNTPISISWSSMEDITSSDTFLILTFTVRSEAKVDSKAEIAVLYNVGDFCNINEEDILFDIVNGSVTVK